MGFSGQELPVTLRRGLLAEHGSKAEEPRVNSWGTIAPRQPSLLLQHPSSHDGCMGQGLAPQPAPNTLRGDRCPRGGHLTAKEGVSSC